VRVCSGRRSRLAPGVTAILLDIPAAAAVDARMGVP